MEKREQMISILSEWKERTDALNQTSDDFHRLTGAKPIEVRLSNGAVFYLTTVEELVDCILDK